jgi:hypothetical protein
VLAGRGNLRGIIANPHEVPQARRGCGSTIELDDGNVHEFYFAEPVLAIMPSMAEVPTKPSRRPFRFSFSLWTLFGVITLCAAGLAWFVVPVRHEAFALLKVSGKTQSMLPTSHGAGEDFSVFKRTQIQLILSNVVLLRTVVEPAIAALSVIREHDDDPVSWLKEQLVINYPDDTEIMRVSLKATDADEAIKIVDMVVKKYMKEIVQRERDLRDLNERKLQDTYEHYVNKCKDLEDVVHKMEKLHNTSSTEAAQLKKKLATRELDENLARRAKLVDQIDETAMQIMLARARQEIPQGTRASDAGSADKSPSTDSLNVSLLEKQGELLEDRFEAVEVNIAKQVHVLESMDSFSAAVEAKLAELRALKKITSDLRTELDHVKLERLAPERITQVFNAVVLSADDDAARKYVVVSVAAMVGLGLIMLGVWRRGSGGRH